MTVPSVAAQIEKMPSTTWRDTLRAGWISFRISASAILAGALTQAYVSDGCRSVADFRVWFSDGHAIGFIIANLIAPIWRGSTAYQRSKESQNGKP